MWPGHQKPDLRRMAPATDRIFYDIVLNGAYVGKGMARWDDVLSQADAVAIHAYIVDAAWAAYSAARAGSADSAGVTAGATASKSP